MTIESFHYPHLAKCGRGLSMLGCGPDELFACAEVLWHEAGVVGGAVEEGEEVGKASTRAGIRHDAGRSVEGFVWEFDVDVFGVAPDFEVGWWGGVGGVGCGHVSNSRRVAKEWT